jgi:Ser/Thr protein kinase RdoA (MazF antagonist)
VTDPVVASAVRDAVSVAAAYGVRCDDPLVLKETANVVVHLRPWPVVAKVAASTRDLRVDVDVWLGRELAMAQHVAAAGLPTTLPSDLLPAQVHNGAEGNVISFWQHVVHDPDAQIAPEQLGVMLARLHVVLADVPPQTPSLHTPLDDIKRYVARASQAGVSGADVARLRAAYERVVANPALSAGAIQTLHGDSHPGNLLHSPGGWVWCDYEDTCAGPTAWDLAAMVNSGRVDGAAALAAYDLPYEDAQVAAQVELRKLHVTMWAMLFAERLTQHRAYAMERLAAVDTIARQAEPLR